MNRLLILILLAGLATACVPQKKMVYLQETNKLTDTFALIKPENPLILPLDQVYIKVSSFDEVNFNFFGNQSDEVRTVTPEGLSLVSYTVDTYGYITYPVAGRIQIAGLNLYDASLKIKEALSEYFNQPTVIVKFVNKTVTVLGEVRAPGDHVYSREQINIFQALSLAGDITDFGNRKQIFILREKGKQVEKIRVDLTDENFLASEYYYLQPYDIVYVKPLRAKRLDLVYRPYSLLLSTITAAILVFDYVNTNQ